MHKTLVATRYEILRGVRCDSTKVAAHLPEKPVRGVVLLVQDAKPNYEVKK